MATERSEYAPVRKPAAPPPPKKIVPTPPVELVPEPDYSGDDTEGHEVPEADGTLPVGLAVMIVVLLDISGSLFTHAEQIRNYFSRMIESLKQDAAARVCVDFLLVTFSDRADTDFL